MVVLEGVGAFAGQELHGRIEPEFPDRWDGWEDQAIVRIGGLGVFVWIEPKYMRGTLQAAGLQVGGGRTGWRLPPSAVGLARCYLGLAPEPGYECPCMRCARRRMRVGGRSNPHRPEPTGPLRGDGYQATEDERLDAALASLDLDDQARVLLMSLGDRAPRLRALADASPGLISAEMRERVAGFLATMGIRVGQLVSGALRAVEPGRTWHFDVKVPRAMSAPDTLPALLARAAHDELFVRLWEAINGYAVATGGDMSTGTISDRRMDAVVAVESAVTAIANDACLTARSFAREGGWRSLAQAIGNPGLELEPERLVAVIVERLNVLEACKIPNDAELGGLVRAAAGLPGPVIVAMRDVGEACGGEIEAGGLRRAFQKLGGALQAMCLGRVVEESTDLIADNVVLVREVLSATGYTREVEVVAAWTSEQRRAALLWATRGRLVQPPEPPPPFLEEGDA